MKGTAQALVLAAGRSSRFKTGRTKLVEKICGMEMIGYPLNVLEQSKIPTTVIVGFQSDEIKETAYKYHSNVSFASQEKPKGTGDAVLTSRPLWSKDHILIINGDMPLVTSEIVDSLFEAHHKNDAAMSFVTSDYKAPQCPYGRVIQKDGIVEIVEAKNFTGDPHEHCCINAGIYLCKRSFLEEHVDKISQNSVSQEWYLTDLAKIGSTTGHRVETVDAPFDRIRGVNTLYELWNAEQIIKDDITHYWMDHGVRFTGTHTIQLDKTVSIGSGSVIGAGVHLLGATTVGKNVTIDPFCIISDTHIEEYAHVKAHSVITDSDIKAHATVGPFAHIRTHSTINSHTTVGNFVEVKKSHLGQHTHAKHLTYLGDTTTGEHVNIGAGTITCNFDGRKKHQTIIGNYACIGSNNSLVAPISIGTGAYTGAGSVLTCDVPDHALALGRARQINKDQYAKKYLSTDKKNSFIGALKSTEQCETEK